MRILVVDDERPIVEALTYNLRKEGYETISAADADQCLALARAEKPDLILLDVMLPSASGFDVCRQLRSESPVPIILLTARAAETDRVVGLELGADDYVTKPFSMRELMARVRSNLRRNAPGGPEAPDPDNRKVHVGDLSIDPVSRMAANGKGPIRLSRKEFDLLYFLATHPNQAFSRQTLLDRVWGTDAYVEERTVDVHIRWLREKTEATPSRPKHLVTVRGIGYRFDPH